MLPSKGSLSIKKRDVTKPVRHFSGSMQIRTEDGHDNLIGLLMKNCPPSQSRASSEAKLDYKNASTKQTVRNNTTLHQKPWDEPEKHKEKDGNQNKKLKTDTLSKSDSSFAAELPTVKKDNKSFHPTKTYICKFCCRRFHSIDLLREHSKSHGNKPTHACYLCNHQTGSFSSLMTHYLRHSGTKGSKIEKIYAKSKADFCNIQFNIASRPKTAIRCVHCKGSFGSKEKFETHQCTSVEKKTEYKCVYCGHMSPTIEDYRQHYHMHSETPFVCCHCGYKAQTKKQLDRHGEMCIRAPKRGRPSLKCKECHVRFKNREELKLHSERCSKNSHLPEYKCKYCQQFFKGGIELNYHVQSCKPNPTKTFPCEICSSVFKKEAELENHKKTCIKVKQEIISKDASNTAEKIQNKQAKHLGHLCSLCGAMFKTESLFSAHNRQCLKRKEKALEKVHLCSFCGKTFTKLNEFQQHEMNCLQSPEKKNEAQNVNEVIPKLSVKLADLKRKAKARLEEHHEKSPEDKDLQNDSESDLPMTRRSARLERKKSVSHDDGIQIEDKKSPKTRSPRKPKQIAKIKIKKKIKCKVKKSEQNASFFCNSCDLSFCSKSSLIRHKRMHSGHPWFTCKFCGKFFFRKDVFIRHEANVHTKSSKTVFCCCYCKLYFNSSSSLKEHAMLLHRDSAFLPSRSPNKENKTQVKVKLEPSSDSELPTDVQCDSMTIASEANKSVDIKNVIASPEKLFKCGLCLVTFNSLTDIEQHFADAHHTEDEVKSDEEKLIINETTIPSEQVMLTPCTTPIKSKESDIQPRAIFDTDILIPLKVKIEQQSVEEPSQMVEQQSQVTEQPLLVVEQPPQVVEQPPKVVQQQSASEIEDTTLPVTNGNTEIDIEAIFRANNAKLRKPVICKICSKRFTDRLQLAAHEDMNHKIIDFYQCIVCDTIASKQDMAEHMFKHAFRLGTFAVTDNSHNFISVMEDICNNSDYEHIEAGITASTSGENNSSNPELSQVETENLPLLIDIQNVNQNVIYVVDASEDVGCNEVEVAVNKASISSDNSEICTAASSSSSNENQSESTSLNTTLSANDENISSPVVSEKIETASEQTDLKTKAKTLKGKTKASPKAGAKVKPASTLPKKRNVKKRAKSVSQPNKPTTTNEPIKIKLIPASSESPTVIESTSTATANKVMTSKGTLKVKLMPCAQDKKADSDDSTIITPPSETLDLSSSKKKKKAVRASPKKAATSNKKTKLKSSLLTNKNKSLGKETLTVTSVSDKTTTKANKVKSTVSPLKIVLSNDRLKSACKTVTPNKKAINKQTAPSVEMPIATSPSASLKATISNDESFFQSDASSCDKLDKNVHEKLEFEQNASKISGSSEEADDGSEFSKLRSLLMSLNSDTTADDRRDIDSASFAIKTSANKEKSQEKSCYGNSGSFNLAEPTFERTEKSSLGIFKNEQTFSAIGKPDAENSFKNYNLLCQNQGNAPTFKSAEKSHEQLLHENIQPYNYSQKSPASFKSLSSPDGNLHSPSFIQNMSAFKNVQPSPEKNSFEEFASPTYSPKSVSTFEKGEGTHRKKSYENLNSCIYAHQNAAVSKPVDKTSENVDACNFIQKNISVFSKLEKSAEENSYGSLHLATCVQKYNQSQSAPVVTQSHNELIEQKPIYGSMVDEYTRSLSNSSNQGVNTCLKFDVSQSRGDFLVHESHLALQNVEMCNTEKEENPFKANQSKILDFSDMLQNTFGESSGVDDDNSIFRYYSPTNQVQESIFTDKDQLSVPNTDYQDVTSHSNSCAYTTTSVSKNVRCYMCHSVFNDTIELANHTCLMDSSSAKQAKPNLCENVRNNNNNNNNNVFHASQTLRSLLKLGDANLQQSSANYSNSLIFPSPSTEPTTSSDPSLNSMGAFSHMFLS